MYPLSFEALGQGYGFIMYTTTLDNPNVDGMVLSIPGIRDRGYVQIGSVGKFLFVSQFKIFLIFLRSKGFRWSFV
jgi:hypothetical protein